MSEQLAQGLAHSRCTVRLTSRLLRDTVPSPSFFPQQVPVLAPDAPEPDKVNSPEAPVRSWGLGAGGREICPRGAGVT